MTVPSPAPYFSRSFAHVFDVSLWSDRDRLDSLITRGGPPEIGRVGDRERATRCLHPSDGPRWNTRHEDLGCPRRMTGRAVGAWAPAPHQQCHMRQTPTSA